MSVNTWTPTALASEFVGWEGSGWRAVEAQHKVASMGLVHGNVGAQAVLEDILEEVKPVLPPEVKGLHWLLAPPFVTGPCREVRGFVGAGTQVSSMVQKSGKPLARKLATGVCSSGMKAPFSAGSRNQFR